VHEVASFDVADEAGLVAQQLVGSFAELVALAGLFSDWDTIDADVKDIVTSRRRAGQRAAPRLD